MLSNIYNIVQVLFHNDVILHNYMLTVTLLERVFKYLSNDTLFAIVGRYVLIKICPCIQ